MSSVRTRIVDELRHLLGFICSPRRRHPIHVAAPELMCRIVILLGVNALFTLAIAFPIQTGLESLVGMHAVVDSSTITFLFSVVFVAPWLEELIFRAGLRSATVTLAIQPMLVCLMLGQWRIALALACVSIAIVLVDGYRQRRRNASEQFALRMARGRAFLSRYRLIVWTYALAFGLSHLGHFDVDAHAGWLALLVVFAVISQTWSGLLLSYLRLRYGLLSAIVFHTSFNAAALAIDQVTR
ncbi:MAG: hypothetical protein JWP59_2900 [Massilia sp.]|nr:hypothetical protein [Massilia sp.]